MSALFGVPVDAAYHLVFALTNVLTPLLGGLAAVAGIVVFTAAVRLGVMPLSFRAMRGQAAQARIAPQVKALRERHARQPERFQRELSALYQREGTSLFAGFAPILAQWPVFSVLYLLFRSPNVAGGPNRLLSRDLFGVPLGGHWLGGAAFGAHGAVFLGVFAVLAAICWVSARVARRMSAAIVAPGKAPARAPGKVPGKAVAKAPGKAVAKAPGKATGTATASAPASVPGARVLAAVLPYITVVIALFAPLAAGVYLVTSTAWGVAERWAFTRATLRSRAGRP
jgi:YidC/Oxa1 family membrane protein insertase